MSLCRICRDAVAETKHLPIYAFGSEGVEVCENCDVAIAEFVRALAATATRSHLLGYKRCKEVQKEKEAK